MHSTEHAAVPQLIWSPHAYAPVHWTSHAEAGGHVMWCEHALSPHTTRHGTPAGHVMSTAHEFATLQSITHVP